MGLGLVSLLIQRAIVRPGCHGVPTSASSQRSSPYQPATFHAAMSRMATVNSTGFVLVVPANMKPKFMRAPKKAAMPVNATEHQPDPDEYFTEDDEFCEPRVMAAVQQNWMNARYQSYVMAALPVSGMATALVKYPRSAAPPCIHAGLNNLPQPGCQPLPAEPHPDDRPEPGEGPGLKHFVRQTSLHESLSSSSPSSSARRGSQPLFQSASC